MKRAISIAALKGNIPKSVWPVFFAMCVVVILVAMVFGNVAQAPLQQTSQNQATQQEDATSEYVAVEGRYLFNGTIVLARAVEKYANGNYAQPFSGLSTLQPEAYDAWAADFECPITSNVVPYSVQIEKLVFNCRPEWLPELTKYVQLFNLANNHTGDQGFPEGFNETRQHLQQAGVQYFGNYDPTVLEDICEVIALPVRLQKTNGSQEKAALPVAFCSWHYFNFGRGPTTAELDVIEAYAAVMPVFAFVEMGNEYQATASTQQRTIAKSILDKGADFVMANNPHWVQDSEMYKGKLIVYSLGNFIFDQIDAETQRGVSFDTTLRITYDSNISAWLALANTCKEFKDSCLQSAVKQQLKKPTVQLTYVPVASQGGAGKITTKASEAVQKAVEERLLWQQVKTQLGQ
jgi:Bacterial capsule synthesis protein PGA_cap